MKHTESGEKKATRQCWECLKRRLVCDHTLPHCKKCQKAGKECPGYDEQKPLQWIQPGKVTSRRRKKDITPKIYKTPSVERPKLIARETIVDLELPPLTSAASSLVASTYSVFEDLSFQPLTPYTSFAELEWGYVSDEQKQDCLGTDYESRLHSGLDLVGKIFAMGGREKLEEVVNGQLEDEAKQLCPKNHPLERLEYILRLIENNDLPNYTNLSHHTDEVVQAVNYYNVRIHPTYVESGTLAPNPALIKFPLEALHILPPAIHHTLVCLSLNHFIHSLPAGSDKTAAVINRSKVYQHRGAAIRALSQYVGKDKTQSSDLSIASILMFMSMELQNPAMADWRSHASGVKRLVEMRGGFRALIKSSPHLAPTLVVYILIMTMANTCSPSWDQLPLSETADQSIADVSAIYSLVFPYTLCPPVLFTDVLCINQLRSAASAVLFAGDLDPNHTLDAHDLLAKIESFSPEDWAQPGEHFDEWLLVGTIYQSAIALYCTMSLQSLTILPNTLEMNAMRSVHGSKLLSSLRPALANPRLHSFLIWPLTVAGVECGYRDEATQYWVGNALGDLSRVLGTSSPLKAQAVLRRYWGRDERGWDECFERPYVFVI